MLMRRFKGYSLFLLKLVVNRDSLQHTACSIIDLALVTIPGR